MQDTGIGIKQEALKNIFDSFTQADASVSRQYGGTGLGLTICKRLVEMMGGSIEVQSKEGEGSTFSFNIPLPINPQQSQYDITEHDLTGKRVLVVDDNDVSRRVLKEQLNGFGCHCDSVSSGTEALETIRKSFSSGNPYDCGIIDFFMPDMNGIEVGKKIREHHEMDVMKLMLLTSSIERGLAKQSTKAGFQAFSTKPILKSLLHELLLTVLHTQTGKDKNELITKHTIKELQSTQKQDEPNAVFQSHPRILLAEDNIVNQKVAVKILEKLGCRVDVVANGIEAVEMVQKFPYDLVLMDVQMPEMDGYEATQHLRTLEKETLKHLPVIAMTANAMQGDREKCLEAGMDDYISKPIDKKILQTVIQNCVSY